MPSNYEGKVATAQIQMPREAAGASVKPMNRLEELLLPQAAAITWPWGRVAMNQPVIEQAGLDPGDVMTHELTHVGQQQKEGMLRTLLKSLTASPDYLARPYEQEALMAEQIRPIRRTDIALPDPNAPVRQALKRKVHNGR